MSACRVPTSTTTDHIPEGVCEFLGQTASICWADRFERRIEKPILPPVFIDRANASCEFSALEASLKGFDLQSLFQMADTTPFVMLALRGDGAASNARLKAYVLQQIMGRNAQADDKGLVLVVDITCHVHALMAIMTKESRLKKVIPKCYSLNWTFRFPPRLCLKYPTPPRRLCPGSSCWPKLFPYVSGSQYASCKGGCAHPPIWMRVSAARPTSEGRPGTYSLQLGPGQCQYIRIRNTAIRVASGFLEFRTLTPSPASEVARAGSISRSSFRKLRPWLVLDPKIS